MAFQPLADGLKAVTVWGDGTKEWTNTTYYTRPGYTLADQQVMADFVQDTYENLADLFLVDRWSLLACKTYDMRSELAPIVFDQRPAHPGTIALAAGAIGVGLVVTFYTAQRGKSGRGRNYLAGFAEDDMGAVGIDDPVLVTNIATWYQTMLPQWVANNWTWVIASGQQGGVVLPSLQPFPVTSTLIRNSVFGSQRRRTGKD